MTLMSAYSALERLGPAVTTAEAAAALGRSASSASRVLAELAKARRVSRIKPGLWWLQTQPPDPFSIASELTSPHPAYVSMLSALNYHGVIDQLPRDIELASLDRARKIQTSVGVYRVHHLPPELFGGWESSPRGPVATVEKALFDLCYVGVVSAGRPRYVPELDLSADFDRTRIDDWAGRIRNSRLRTMTMVAVDKTLARSVR
jgi:predicted transcriptional regulator of viral defense system